MSGVCIPKNQVTHYLHKLFYTKFKIYSFTKFNV